MDIYKNIKILVVLFSLVCTTSVNSQDYFPLSIGNSWTYREIGIDHPGLPIKILDSLHMAGNTCFYYGSDLETADLICADSLGNIWKIIEGEKCLWFDFTLAESDSYLFKPNEYHTYVVKINRDISSETKFGLYEHCIDFTFDDPNAIDEEQYCRFAPGLGMIERGNGMGIFHVLDSAVIDGQQITTVLADPTSPAPQISLRPNYPNPFNQTTTVEFTLDREVPTKLLLADMNGRIHKVLLNQTVAAGHHSVVLDASHFASGTYLLNLQAGQKRFAQKVVLLK